MSSKREYSDVDDGEIPEPDLKRVRTQGARARQHQNSGIDPTWGQKYVFSSYDDATTVPIGEEEEFEDDADAMAYLKSVRQEASGIPHLLVAPKPQIGPQLPAELRGDRDSSDQDEDGEAHEVGLDRSIYVNGMGDSRGFYEDGAYTAMPHTAELQGADDEDGDAAAEKAIQEAYFASLLNHYLRLREMLHAAPPPGATNRLSSSQPVHAARFGRKSATTANWTRLIRDTEPHPLQLALMSKDSVLRILRVILSGNFLRRGYPLPERTSRWLWALLARLPTRGELNHTEVGWVRDLGRRAVLLGRSLAEMAALREELHEGGLGANEGVDASSSDEDVVAEADSDGVVEANNSPSGRTDDTAPTLTVAPQQDAPKVDTQPPEVEEGEAAEHDAGDAAMDLASDSEAEEGAISDDDADLERARSKLLARLDSPISENEPAEELVKERSRMNMRATLNMILTVAGEFYGQRDLLEFREPFVGM